MRSAGDDRERNAGLARQREMNARTFDRLQIADRRVQARSSSAC